MLKLSRSYRNASEHVELVREKCELHSTKVVVHILSAGFSQASEVKAAVAATFA